MIQDSLWKLLGMILCVVLIFVVPTLSLYERQDKIIYDIMQTETDMLAQKVREVGFIDHMMLNEYKSTIQGYGLSFSIEMEHQMKQFTADQGVYKSYYVGTFTEDIVRVIENRGRYDLGVGDFFFIRVRNTSPSRYGALLSGFGYTKEGLIFAYSGGIVRYGDT